MTTKRAFVFVVCGEEEHIRTLELSHSVLRSKTEIPIYIVTDSSRNAIPISLPNTLNIETPKAFNNHQASIYLKTSLHKQLPANCTYVYLDSDILAVGKAINHIFEQFKSPITFGPDHCKMNQFSPYAVNCGCLNEFEKYRSVVYKILDEKDPLKQNNKEINPRLFQQRQRLEAIFQQLKKNNIISKFFQLVRFMLSYPRFKLNQEFYYNRKTHLWYNNNDEPIKHHISNRNLAKQAGIKWKLIGDKLLLPDGRPLWNNSCNHLSNYIQQTFSTNFVDPNWQHWNGGVFIFSNESREFMDTWHQLTMEIFKNPNWKTRDQGTLIATVWKLGLSHHPTLDIKWNMILDYHNHHLNVNNNNEITIDGSHYIAPEFVHIYHHWGDENWEIWNNVMSQVKNGKK